MCVCVCVCVSVCVCGERECVPNLENGGHERERVCVCAGIREKRVSASQKVISPAMFVD